MHELLASSEWFWLADDGRVYSGPLEAVVAQADAGYVSFIENGFIATAWPRDDAGAQTDASMQEVLTPNGMFVNLKYYTVDRRWLKEQGGIVCTAGFPIRTNDRAQAKITGLYTAAVANPAVVTAYHASDNTVHPLDAAGMTQLHDDLLTHINFCFDTSATLLAGIDNGTITTRAEVDAAFGAAMTEAQKNWLKP